VAEDWASVAAEVAEALSEFSEITIHQPASDGVFDPMTDTTSGASPAQHHVGAGLEDTYSAFSVAQGVVEANDIKFLLSPLKKNGQPMPRPVPDQWAATLGGKVHAIKRVEPTQPAGLPLMFELQLRRS
jgi:hypothetical protein